jgi:hypothetical protein
MIVFNRSSALAPFFPAGFVACCEDCTGRNCEVGCFARRGLDGIWKGMGKDGEEERDGERERCSSCFIPADDQNLKSKL